MVKRPRRDKHAFFFPAGTQLMADEDFRDMYDVSDPLGRRLYDEATKPGAAPGYSIPTREDGKVPWGEVYDAVIDDDWRADRPEAQHWTSDELHEALSLCIGLAPGIVIPLIQKHGPDFGFSQEDYSDDNKEQVLLAMDEIARAAKPGFLAELRRLEASVTEKTDLRLSSKLMTASRRCQREG